MKSLFIPAFIFLSFFAGTNAHAQSLLTVANTTISKEEFLQAFRKNNTDSVLNERSVREYLELFIRFKLKVKAAAAAKIDSLPVQKAELNEFRSQLSESYLVDEVSFRHLVNEAKLRGRKDIHLAHIFIPFVIAAGQQNPDTAFASRQAEAAYQALKKGTDFAKVASEFSVDTAAKGGDAGFISVFTLPYSLESVIFQTPVGEYSKPVRSTAGYHIFKNLGERAAAGKTRVAQIMLALRPNPTDSMVQRLRVRADSVYAVLQEGVSFNEMVQKYSDDNTSINAKGELPLFGLGTYDQVFENAAFALTTDGQISRPVQTAFGFHIIKRLERIPTIDTDSTLVLLEEAVRKNERMEVSKMAFLKKIYAVINYRDLSFDQVKFRSQTDSVLAGTKLSAAIAQQRLFTMGNESKTFGDWSKYLMDVKSISSLSMGKTVDELYRQFREASVTDFYRNNLERFNKEYSTHLQEFREGNMLFEMMQRMVWDKASRDTAGQLKYFNAHRSSYVWKPSADAIIFSALDSVSANVFYQNVQADPAKWRNSMLSFLDKAQADSGRFEIDQLPVDAKSTTVGKLTKPLANPGGSNIYSFLYLVKMYPANTAKNFEDARANVLNDYQQYLEESWIKSLKLKYPVKVNEQVLKTIWR